MLVDRLRVRIFDTKAALSTAAAQDAARLLREGIARQGHVRLIVATGNSQVDMIAALAAAPDIDWRAVEVFHMDEYIGLSDSHPASFRLWVRTRLVEAVHPAQVHYLNGGAADPEAECRRYAALLTAAPVDVCCLGIGENGHIAFNDPHVADFADPLIVKRVTLDRECRLQQVGEGHFPDLDAAPKEALTLTCPALMAAKHLVASVPDLRKAAAVKRALEGPVEPACPGSLLRTHPSACLYLDYQSASMWAGFHPGVIRS